MTYEEILLKSSDAMDRVTTYRIGLTGNMTANDETSEMDAVMEFNVPDKMRSVQTLPGKSESIIINGYTYTKSEYPSGNTMWLARRWPGHISNTVSGFIDELVTLSGVKKLGDERIDGESCFHYAGQFDTSAQYDEEKANLDANDPGYESRLSLLETLKNTKHTAELWIGKEDYYLRKLAQYQEITVPGGDDSTENIQKIYSVFRFYDFNQDIVVEAPSPDQVQGVFLTYTATDSIGGSDISNQQINYEIFVLNRGNETARDLEIFIDTPVTNQGETTIRALPENENPPVNLGTGESANYTVTWEYDMTQTSKQGLAALMEKNVIRAEWNGNSSKRQTETLTGN